VALSSVNAVVHPGKKWKVGYTLIENDELAIMNSIPRLSKPLMRVLHCPGCGRENILRSRCFRLFERVADLMFLSPFRCRSCSHRFYAFRLGSRYSMDMVERRQHQRIQVRLQLSFSGGRIRGSGTVRDISMGGCVIESETIVHLDDIFYLQLYLAEHDPPIQVAAMVTSVRSRRIAFKFLRTARENKRLFDFLHAKGAAVN